MKIYFDNVLIDEERYIELSQDSKLFYDTNTFCLGKTFCNNLTLKLNGGVSSAPTNIKITLNNVDYGYYIVDSMDEEYGITTIKLTDKMVKFNFNYSAKEIIEASTTGYVTLLAILQDICTKAGVLLDSNSTTFYGYNKHITWYDNTITAREYIGYIAELNGGFARINKSGKLELFKFTNTPVQTISIADVDNYKIGEYHKITRVVLDDGLGTYDPVGTDTNDTLYINANNVYITKQADLTAIYNQVNNKEFYSMKIDNCPISNDVKSGDCLCFNDGTTNYYFLAQLENTYNRGWIGGYTFEVNSILEAETTIKNNLKDEVRTIKTRVDRDEGELEIVATKVDELEDSIEVLRADLSSNVIIISTDSQKKPTATKTYIVDYVVKYIGATITLRPTTSDTHTGITCSIGDNSITFGVTSGTTITALDNKYTFTWTYGTYTVTRTVMLSVVTAPEADDQIYVGSTAPSDTSKLWLDTSRTEEKTSDQLKRYNTTTTEWEIVNDYSSDIEALEDSVTTNTTNINTLNISTGNISSEVSTTKSQIGALETAVETINGTMREQTDTAITTYFTNTIKPLMDAMNEDIVNNTNDITSNTTNIAKFQSYIKESIDTDSESPYYNMAYLEIGTSNNDVKVRLYPTVLAFYENGSQVAYISNNSLYITESTILTTLRLGRWVAVEDSDHNLNIKWNGV